MPWIKRDSSLGIPAHYKMPKPLSDNTMLGRNGSYDFAIEQRKIYSKIASDANIFKDLKKEYLKNQRCFDWIVKYYEGNKECQGGYPQALGQDLAQCLDNSFLAIEYRLTP